MLRDTICILHIQEGVSTMCDCHGKDSEHHGACNCVQDRGGRFTEPYLLLILAGKASHGYELASHLSSLQLPEGAPDPATIYRNLRQMEETGLVRSRWETSGAGPAKRLYELTSEGEELLQSWASHIQARRDALDEFLRVYSERFASDDGIVDEGR